ncbi:hypothetical protein BGW41_003253 [Actinomortierella wolfii]|nr:hypothetical protein BGW41_003253 [Actinomortierella wolfii]
MDLSDGIILFEVAADVDAKWFKSIRSADMGDNWVHKYNNLKKLYKLVTRYIEERLGQTVASLEPPNLNAIAKDGDIVETLKLCALLIAVTVQCERNTIYIQRIQTLPQETQAALMFSLEQTIEALNNGVQMPDSDVEDTVVDQELVQLQLQSERDELERNHQALINEFNNLKGKYEESQIQCEDMKLRLRDLERASAQASQSGKSDFLMRTEIEHLRQDLQKSEDRRHEQQILLNNQMKTIADLSRSVTELQAKAEEAARLKDKLDEYKHTIEKLQKTENVIEKYKKKLEESADLRRQMKLLDEQNQELSERNKEIEEEYRKVLAFKSLMESYKEQIMTLESKSSNLLLEKNKAEHQLKQQIQRFHELEADHARDLEQIQMLEEKVRELELSGGGMGGGGSSLAHDMMDIENESEGNLGASLGNTTELKLTISRLEREIRTLKEENERSSADAQTTVLQHLLEDANRLKAKYEGDYLAEHQAKLVLQAELDRLRPQQVTATTSVSSQDADAATQALLASIQATLQEREHELNETKAQLVSAKESEQANEELKKRLAALEEENKRLKQLTAGQSSDGGEGTTGAPTARELQLEEQLKQMTEQMNQCSIKLQRAKEFIVQQDAFLKDNNGKGDASAEHYPEAVESLQSELDSKNEEIKRLKIQMQEKLIQWRREQQLMVSAWHDQLKKGLRENVLAQHQRMAPTSWLGVQRKVFSSQLGVRA